MQQLFPNTPELAPLYYFQQLAAIPRPSGGEQAVSNFLKELAEQHGLWCHQDDCWNLIIKKPASAGCEQLPPVILQAHMDMVCEKTPESTHNFDTDPIPLTVEDGWLRSAAGTTLGADNGIGVAMCMAVLLSEELIHPPIEVLLTVEEESTFRGAENVDWSLLQGRRLINLDHAVEHQVLTGSCGGSGAELFLPMERQEEPVNDQRYQLSVTGLPGGHSGEDIHRGRGNANQLLNRVLRQLAATGHLRLYEFTGGAFRLAIPREAHAIISWAGELAELTNQLQALEATLRREYQAAAPELGLHLSATQEGTEFPFTQQATDRFVSTVSLFPNGIQQMNGAFPGTVESSINLGVVTTQPDGITLTAEIRGGYLSTVADVQEKITALAGLVGGTCRFFAHYAPWESRPASALRKAVCQCYQRLYQQPMEPVVVHAGIECGCFLQQVPSLDAIAIGPDCQFMHAPTERLNVASTQRSWRLLTTLLQELASV